MAFSFLAKCLVGVSTAGVASFFPIYYSLGGESSNSQNVASSDLGNPRSSNQDRNRVTTTQERKSADRRHDDCLNNNVQVKIRNPRDRREEKTVTWAEQKANYKGWEILDMDYKPQCSRELPNMQ